VKEKSTPNILLGSGRIDPAILGRVIESFYSKAEGDEEKADRRKYKGKHQKQPAQKNLSNSPMVIQLKT